MASVGSILCANGAAHKSRSVRRALKIKEDLSFIIGPSSVKREATRPIEPSPAIFFIFPSFMRISSTEESRPPYLAGKPPLISVIVFNASALKTEKKPNR